jgi:hypothetical protein
VNQDDFQILVANLDNIFDAHVYHDMPELEAIEDEVIEVE